MFLDSPTVTVQTFVADNFLNSKSLQLSEKQSFSIWKTCQSSLAGVNVLNYLWANSASF